MQKSWGWVGRAPMETWQQPRHSVHLFYTALVRMRVSIAVMEHMTKSKLGRRAFIWLNFHMVVHHEGVRTGSQGGHRPEVGAEAEDLRNYLDPQGLLNLLSY